MTRNLIGVGDDRWLRESLRRDPVQELREVREELARKVSKKPLTPVLKGCRLAQLVIQCASSYSKIQFNTIYNALSQLSIFCSKNYFFTSSVHKIKPFGYVEIVELKKKLNEFLK